MSRNIEPKNQQTFLIYFEDDAGKELVKMRVWLKVSFLKVVEWSFPGEEVVVTNQNLPENHPKNHHLNQS